MKAFAICTILVVGATAEERRAFTAYAVTTSTSPGSGDVVRERTVFAALTSGSTVFHRTRLSNGKEFALVDLLDLETKSNIGIDHFTKSITRRPLMPGEPAAQSCHDPVYADAGTLLSFPVRMRIDEFHDAKTGAVRRLEAYAAPT